MSDIAQRWDRGPGCRQQDGRGIGRGDQKKLPRIPEDEKVTKSDSNDALLNRDWSAEWERLPAVKLPGSRAAAAGRITIRLAASALAALKILAKRKTLPYHALARSWIVGSLS